jgi:hypothetical protein
MKTACGTKTQLCKIIATLSIFASFCALAQAQPQRSNGRRGGPVQQLPGKSVRERVFSLPPTDQQVFRRNAERWMQMSPEERQIMRQRESLRRERIKRETEAALHDSGLLLDQQKRDLFESRYMQERRKMEQALRHQVEAERQQQLPALIQQLKKEFQSQQPNGRATAKPAGSPKSDR